MAVACMHHTPPQATTMPSSKSGSLPPPAARLQRPALVQQRLHAVDAQHAAGRQRAQHARQPLLQRLQGSGACSSMRAEQLVKLRPEVM